MKNIRLTVLILITLSCLCCNNKNIDITGKWYLFNVDDGYIEFTITQSHIIIFSHHMGNQPSIRYKVISDSLYYIDSVYKAKITLMKDSLLILKDTQHIDTLIRLDDSILTFTEIDNNSDSVLENFYKEFQQRAFNSWIKHGYITREELENSFVDTLELVEENIPIIKSK